MTVHTETILPARPIPNGVVTWRLPGKRRGVRSWLCRRAARLLTLLFGVVISRRRLRKTPSRPYAIPQGCEILLTGRFESANWVTSHVRPLAASPRCSRLYVVSTYPVPETPGVTPIYPPRWLRRLVGQTAARLLVFLCVGFLRRPDIVGGFHLLINGLVAISLAPLVALLLPGRTGRSCRGRRV